MGKVTSKMLRMEPMEASLYQPIVRIKPEALHYVQSKVCATMKIRKVLDAILVTAAS